MDKHLGRAQELKRVFRPRVIVYTGVLVLLVAGLLSSLLMRSPFRVDVVRDRGVLSRVVDDGWVENVYRLQLMNASERDQRYRISARGLPGLASDLKSEIGIAPAQARWVPLALRVPPEAAAQAGAGSHAIEFVVERVAQSADDVPRSQIEKSTFMVPR